MPFINIRTNSQIIQVSLSSMESICTNKEWQVIGRTSSKVKQSGVSIQIIWQVRKTKLSVQESRTPLYQRNRKQDRAQSSGFEENGIIWKTRSMIEIWNQREIWSHQLTIDWRHTSTRHVPNHTSRPGERDSSRVTAHAACHVTAHAASHVIPGQELGGGREPVPESRISWEWALSPDPLPLF